MTAIRHTSLASSPVTHIGSTRLPRRRLLRHALMGGAALLAPALAARVAPAAAQIVASEQQRAANASFAGVLHTWNSGAAGFFTNTFFYDTGTEVIAFDAQFTPDLAREAISWLATRTASPITALVITHPNPDKFNGLTAFQEAGARVIASDATAAAMPGVHEYKKAFFVGTGMFSEATYPPLGSVDETFTGSMTLQLGDGQAVELSELSEPGISSTQTVAFIPARDALIVGDLVHHKLHAWLEGGIVDGQATPTLDGWIADLQELQERFSEDPEPTVYGGRGEPALLSVAVAEQIAYLEKADQIVTDYVAALGERNAELRGEEAGAHYAAIQAELARAFPDYAFPDMIGYSVYGLVNSKL